MSVDLVAPEVIRRAQEIGAAFRNASPFPHVAIDGFFDAAFCDRLVAEFPAFSRGNNRNENGLPGRKATVEDLRALGDAYARADDLFRSPGFATLVGDLTGIPGLLYDPEYVGGGTHENLPGQDLDPHVDFNYHPRTGLHRRLNLIVYLNPEWEEAWGGSLEIHRDPWLPPEQNSVHRFAPLLNRAILFETSERSWHGFEAIRPPPGRPDLSRKSLAIYMYTRERPAQEVAPPHSTVYVERPIPFVLTPGQKPTLAQYDRITRALDRRLQHRARLEQRDRETTTRAVTALRDVLAKGGDLRPADIELLERILRREDAMLRTLYDREKEISRDTLGLDARLAETPGASLPVFGPGSLEKPARGHSEDLWAAPLVEVNLRVTEDVRELVLHGEIPAQLGKPQTLTCTVGGATVERAFGAGSFGWAISVELSRGQAASIVVRAAHSFNPARAGNSEDQRDLAYQLRALELTTRDGGPDRLTTGAPAGTVKAS